MMHNKPYTPFAVREGIVSGPAVDNDFPKSARVALLHCLDDFVEQGAICGYWERLNRECLRIQRKTGPLPEANRSAKHREQLEELLMAAPWPNVFYFCERIYRRLLQAVPERDPADGEVIGELRPLAEISESFVEEMNTILIEENLAWRFEDGVFIRPGKRHLRQMVKSVRLVLARPELQRSAELYMRAHKIFRDRNDDQLPGAALDALIALEAAGRTLFAEGKNKKFGSLIASLRGAGENEIPPALASSMTKLFEMRGALAHGGRDGGNIDACVVEYVLSQVAASITYLADLADARSQPLPF